MLVVVFWHCITCVESALTRMVSLLWLFKVFCWSSMQLLPWICNFK